MLPAVPISNLYLPPEILPGSKVTSVEWSSAPSTLPPLTSARASTALRCWGWSPGFFLFTLMWCTLTGRPLTAARARAILRTDPPPSPMEPSISRSSIPETPPFPVIAFGGPPGI